MSERMALVGLDVHQAQSVAAVLDPVTGELRVERLRGEPAVVVPAFLEGLGRPVRAVYEAGPTGFGLARAATAAGFDVRVVAPGSIPRAPGDRVKTDRRDAKRLVRLFAAGELSFAFVPSAADERFRDLVRCVEDARKDLMRSRHRLSKFLLRPGSRFTGRSWTQPHGRWLRNLAFEDPLSRVTFIDYCAAVEGLVQRRLALIAVLEEAAPTSSHAPVIARLRCFRGIDTLSAAGLCAEVGSFERFAKPSLLSGFLGIVPSPPRWPRPPGRPDRLARAATPARTLDTPRHRPRQAHRHRRDRLRTRARRILLGGRNTRLTPNPPHIRAPGRLPGRARAP